VTEHTQTANQQTSLKDRLDFIGLGKAECAYLAAVAPLVKEAIGGALDAFYRKAKVNPNTAKFFASDAHIAHAKERQASHWNVIAAGRYDNTYVEGVSAIGRTHARLGLEPQWYIGGYTMIVDGIIRAIVKKEMKGFFQEKKAAIMVEHVSAVVKAAMLDMDYAISISTS
jgi:methyl-accepting chemotaxis protein